MNPKQKGGETHGIHKARSRRFGQCNLRCPNVEASRSEGQCGPDERVPVDRRVPVRRVGKSWGAIGPGRPGFFTMRIKNSNGIRIERGIENYFSRRKQSDLRLKAKQKGGETDEIHKARSRRFG